MANINELGGLLPTDQSFFSASDRTERYGELHQKCNNVQMGVSWKKNETRTVCDVFVVQEKKDLGKFIRGWKKHMNKLCTKLICQGELLWQKTLEDGFGMIYGVSLLSKICCQFQCCLHFLTPKVCLFCGEEHFSVICPHHSPVQIFFRWGFFISFVQSALKNTGVFPKCE